MTHPCLQSPALCSFPSGADSIGDPETYEEPQSLMSFSSSLLSVVLPILCTGNSQCLYDCVPSNSPFQSPDGKQQRGDGRLDLPLWIS